MFKDFIFGLKNRLFYSRINKLRRRNLGSNLVKTSKAKSTVPSKISIISELRSKLKFNLRYSLIFAASLLVIFLLVNVNAYSQIKVSRLFDGENYNVQNIVDYDKLNLLFFVYNQKEEDYGEVVDIKSLTISSINFKTGVINYLTINPQIYYESGHRFNKLLNNFTFEQGKINNLIYQLESKIGIRIDRYLAFEDDNLEKFVNQNGFGFSYLENHIKKDSDFYSKFNIEVEQSVSDFVIKNNLKITDSSVDQDILLNSEFFREFIGNFSNVKSYFNFLRWSYEGINTDFTQNEFVQFVYNISTLNKSFKGDYFNKNLINSDFTINNQTLPDEIKNIFTSLDIIVEQTEVEVFNATNQKGLASKKERELRSVGINVVRVGNYFENLPQSYLYIPEGDPEKYKNTILEIRRNMNNNLIIKTEGYKQNYSGNLILIIGESNVGAL